MKMDMALITGTISGLKTASDITKSLLEIKKINDIAEKVTELQSVILSAQSSAIEANSAQFAMIEEMRTLKEEMARMKAWDIEKQRYNLTSPWPGTVVYSLKESMSAGEPPHWICTNCYNDGAKSILIQQQEGNSIVSFSCPKCNNSFRATGRHRSGFNLQY
jgi:hypothetical protein